MAQQRDIHDPGRPRGPPGGTEDLPNRLNGTDRRSNSYASIERIADGLVNNAGDIVDRMAAWIKTNHPNIKGNVEREFYNHLSKVDLDDDQDYVSIADLDLPVWHTRERRDARERILADPWWQQRQAALIELGHRVNETYREMNENYRDYQRQFEQAEGEGKPTHGLHGKGFTEDFLNPISNTLQRSAAAIGNEFTNPQSVLRNEFANPQSLLRQNLPERLNTTIDVASNVASGVEAGISGAVDSVKNIDWGTIQKEFGSEGNAILNFLDPRTNGLATILTESKGDVGVALNMIGDNIKKSLAASKSVFDRVVQPITDILERNPEVSKILREVVGTEEQWKEAFQKPETYIDILSVIVAVAAAMSAPASAPAYAAAQVFLSGSKLLTKYAMGRPITDADALSFITDVLTPAMKLNGVAASLKTLAPPSLTWKTAAAGGKALATEVAKRTMFDGPKTAARLFVALSEGYGGAPSKALAAPSSAPAALGNAPGEPVSASTPLLAPLPLVANASQAAPSATLLPTTATAAVTPLTSSAIIAPESSQTVQYEVGKELLPGNNGRHIPLPRHNTPASEVAESVINNLYDFPAQPAQMLRQRLKRERL